MDLNIEERDEKLRQIIPSGSVIEQVATGFTFTEGPIWCGDYLLFSDIPRNRIIRLYKHSYGPEVTTYRYPSGNSNGLTLDRSGRLIACEHNTRRVTRTEIDGTISILASHYQGGRLNSPNDVVVHSDGSIYFTDPSFGLGVPPKCQEQPCNGIYRIAPDGALTLLEDNFTMPNGLAFSPDEAVLYIDDTRQGHIRVYDVNPDGSIGNGRVLIEMKASEEGAPDGMKVDQQGNIFCTGPGGVWIIEPGGKCLGRILLPEIPSNLTWDTGDWMTLYITARTSVYKMTVTKTVVAPT